MRCCVRRSFDAATISIAFVIFCVLFTLSILCGISWPRAIQLSQRAARSRTPVLPRHAGRASLRLVGARPCAPTVSATLVCVFAPVGVIANSLIGAGLFEGFDDL